MKVAKEAVGRVRIPIQFSKQLGISAGDEVQLIIEYGKICVKKFEREKFKDYSKLGIVRKLDSVDRICVPREYWLLLNAENANEVDIYLDDKTIVILI